MMIFHIIGIGNQPPELSEALGNLIAEHRVFTGGERHYELVKSYLPYDHIWIPVKAPLSALFERYDSYDQPLVVFASGDPLFYGMANTLRQHYPEAAIRTYPYFSSIQLLSHRAGLNMNLLRTVSVHGRSWDALDEAIIRQEPLLGVLTDQEKSPAAIAARLLQYGYTNYSIWIGEDLEGKGEKVQYMELEAAAETDFNALNCVILVRETDRKRSFGIPDEEFEGLPGRPNMITKMPVRLCSLHAMAPADKKVLWDIGFCTGSLSIEAKLQFPQLKIHAFEKRAECEQIIRNNQHQMGAPGIQLHMGDIMEADLTSIEKPQAVFIGGHGGQLAALLQNLDTILDPGAGIVINTVLQESGEEFTRSAHSLNWQIAPPFTLKVDTHNEITILKATKLS